MRLPHQPAVIAAEVAKKKKNEPPIAEAPRDVAITRQMDEYTGAQNSIVTLYKLKRGLAEKRTSNRAILADVLTGKGRDLLRDLRIGSDPARTSNGLIEAYNNALPSLNGCKRDEALGRCQQTAINTLSEERVQSSPPRLAPPRCPTWSAAGAGPARRKAHHPIGIVRAEPATHHAVQLAGPATVRIPARCSPRLIPPIPLNTSSTVHSRWCML